VKVYINTDEYIKFCTLYNQGYYYAASRANFVSEIMNRNKSH